MDKGRLIELARQMEGKSREEAIEIIMPAIVKDIRARLARDPQIRVALLQDLYVMWHGDPNTEKDGRKVFGGLDKGDG